MSGPTPYERSHREFAKTLVVAHGSVAAARRHLEQLWQDTPAEDLPLGVPASPGAVPSIITLTHWRDNADIPVDARLIDEFAQRARAWVTSSALRIGEAAEQSLLAALDADDAKAAQAYASVWSQATDKLAKHTNAALPQLPGGLPAGAKFSLTYQVEAPR